MINLGCVSLTMQFTTPSGKLNEGRVFVGNQKQQECHTSIDEKNRMHDMTMFAIRFGRYKDEFNAPLVWGLEQQCMQLEILQLRVGDAS